MIEGVVLTALCDSTRADAGGKAAALGALLRAGLPVPDGFVVPPGETSPGPEVRAPLRDAVAHALEELGDPVAAVRSSAASEDSAEASAAGQYESVIGVRGMDEVCAAITNCWESARAARVADYWERTAGATPSAEPGMAVLVQQIVDADVSGVMFTPGQPGASTRIEASWGLGLAVVGGTVTPDTYEVSPDGRIRYVVGTKQTRIDLDRENGGTTVATVATPDQAARTLDDDTVWALAELGSRIATILGGPQDIEWAVEAGRIWIVQARPITASLPASHPVDAAAPADAFVGTPGSHGIVTAPARIVRGPSDFAAVQPGDIVICPYSDPAWTPLFTIAAGVVTETGGALSHAAIVAREYGIPAVLGVADATTRFTNGERITLDGTAGIITHP